MQKDIEVQYIIDTLTEITWYLKVEYLANEKEIIALNKAIRYMGLLPELVNKLKYVYEYYVDYNDVSIEKLLKQAKELLSDESGL